MKKVISLFLCCMAAVVCFAGCSGAPRENEAAEEKTFVIETPYCDLQYPEKWKDSVTVDVDDRDHYTVKFSAGGAALFDLTFDGGDGYVLGTLRSEDRNTVLRITSYDFDANDAQYETYCMMQEDVNVILSHLSSEYDFVIGAVIEAEDTSVFEIDTSVGPLFYPEKWRNSVAIDIQDTSIKFSAGGVPLFDLLFGSGEGYLLGTYQDTAICIVSYDIEQGELSDEEYYSLCAMQEDVNVILQHLMEDSDFSLSK